MGQQFRWWAEKEISPLIDAKTITRNTAMAVPARFLEINDTDTADILQEYFVPKEKVQDFITIYKQYLKKYDMHLLNCTIRKTNKDDEALVSYAQSDMYGFVCYYKIATDSSGEKQMQTLTNELMTWFSQNQSTIYLAYKGYYTQDQIHQMYPNLTNLFQLKQTIDPDNLFTSKWYEVHKV